MSEGNAANCFEERSGKGSQKDIQDDSDPKTELLPLQTATCLKVRAKALSTGMQHHCEKYRVASTDIEERTMGACLGQ